MPGKIKNILHQTFGRLTVRAYAGMNGHRAAWACDCECGVQVVVTGSDLRSGNTRSCGCLMREVAGQINLIHGHARGADFPGAYRSWRSMLQRCRDPNSIGWADYGGRGITVCGRWRSFENFYADMGDRPSAGSLERRDVNGNYEPENCFWLPMAQQARNQRKTVRVRLNGQEMIQADAARALGVHPATVLDWRRNPHRLPAGITLDTVAS